jgi:3-oxoadipate enol-lactonase
MSVLEFDDANSIYYTYNAPTTDAGVTFVFVNALTGDFGMWEGEIGEALRAAGHGTLSFNFRGQAQSPIGSDVKIDAAQMTADTAKLLEHVKPQRAVLVGLSIGGLFAIQAWLNGLDDVDIVGNIFINTLRRDGPRLQWINDGMTRCAEVGGLDLMRDLFMPLITNEEFQETARPNFLNDNGYTPMTSADNDYNLLAAGATANWDVPYEKIDMPVLVLTGQQDRLFYVEEDVANRTARMPNARRIDMANAAHMLPVERPTEFSKALLDFAAAL